MAAGQEQVTISMVVRDAASKPLQGIERNFQGIGKSAQAASASATSALAKMDAAVAASTGKFAAAGKTGGEKYATATNAAVSKVNMATPVEKAGKAATSTAAVHGANTGRSFGQTLMNGFMAVGAVAFITRAITGSITKFQDMGVAVNQMKRVTGDTTVEASRLRTELQLSGVSTDKASVAIRLFSKNLGNAGADATKTAKMTSTLGFSFQDASGKIKPMSDILPKLADKFAAMPNGAEKTALAMQLFGRSGADMLPFLNRGAAGLADLAKRSDELGLTLNDKSIAAMAGAKQAARDWSAALEGVQIALGQALTPAMTAVRGFLSEKFIPALQTTVQFIKDNQDWIVPLVLSLGAFFAVLKTGNTALTAFTSGLDLIRKNPWVAIGAGIITVVVAVKALYDRFEGFRNVVDTFISGWQKVPVPLQAAVLAFTALTILHGPLAELFNFLAGRAVAMLASFDAALTASAGTMGFVGAAASAMWKLITGPIGWVAAAIGLVVGAFELIKSQQQDVTGATFDFTAALDDNTGALKENAATVIAKQLADTGSLDRYRALGGNVKDYTIAILGNADAQGRIHTKILDNATAALQSSTGWTTLTDAQKLQVSGASNVADAARAMASNILASGDATGFANDQMTAAMQVNADFASATGELGTRMQNAKDAIAAAAGATDDLKGSAEEAFNPVESMKTAIDDYKTATEGADTATQFLQMSLDKMRGGSITAEQATRANEAAMRQMQSAALDLRDATQAETDAINTNGAGSVEAQRAHLALKSAEDAVAAAQGQAAQSAISMAGAAYNNALQHGTLSDAVRAATGVMETQRQKFIDSATAAGIEAGEANRLADKLGLVPRDVATSFQANNLAAVQQQVDTLNNTLKGMNNVAYHYAIIGDSIVTRASDPTEGSNWGEGTAGGGYAVRAAGGLLRGPGTGTSDSILLRASDGEFIVNAAQTAKHMRLLENLNAGKYAGGGLVSNSVTGTWPSLPSVDILGETASMAAAVGAAVRAALAPMFSAYSGPLTSGVEQWRGTALDALAAAGQSAVWIDDLLRQMQQESGGNPTIGNYTDVNAQNGDPSIGLMQVIGSTFRNTLAAHGFGVYLSSGQTNPFANILAGILYTVDRYGDLGYWARNGFGPYDKGGFFPSGTVGINTSGRDEWVANPQQTAELKKGNLGGKQVTIASGAIQINVGSASAGDRAALRAELERTLRSILNENQQRAF